MSRIHCKIDTRFGIEYSQKLPRDFVYFLHYCKSYWRHIPLQIVKLIHLFTKYAP